MIESARDIPDAQALQADICIVGAGAAGIALALELMRQPLSVLVLEAGGFAFDAATQALYEGSVTDERMHSQPVRFRQRQLGGSTTIWGGRCMPFDAIDFERRDYVPGSGWPISLDDLMPFYPSANRICEAGEFAYTAASAFSTPPPPMIEGFSSENFTDEGLERFSCPTDFGVRYRQKLRAASNVRVILHANVTAISLTPEGNQVKSLHAQTLTGRSLHVKAANYVLAAGGLEVARLLLANRDVQLNGIGNAYDVVGRYYMCHIAGTIGALRFRGPRSGIHHGYDMSDAGVYCRRRLSLLPGVQRSQGLGNFIARLHHPRIPDPAHKDAILSLLFLSRFLIPYEYAKRLHGNERIAFRQRLQHWRNVACRPWAAFGFAWHMLRDRKFAARKFPSLIIRSRANLYSLDFHAEQQPNVASRVTLGDGVDALGVPRLRIDWRYTPGDLHTVRSAIALLAQDLGRSGVGEFTYDALAVESEMTRYGAYDGHHLGTARMGDDPRVSVVDKNCRVHGVENLYVAGSAVFTTSSQANPTLTIVALALRLARHLTASSAGARLSAEPTMSSSVK